MESNNSCKTCKYFTHPHKHYGLCKRYPPPHRIERFEGNFVYNQPYVCEDDWCGEYENVEDNVSNFKEVFEKSDTKLSCIKKW